jgi:hypothetical protein
MNDGVSYVKNSLSQASVELLVTEDGQSVKCGVKLGLPPVLHVGAITIRRTKDNVTLSSLPIYKNIGDTTVRKVPIVRRRTAARRYGARRKNNQVERPQPIDTGLGQLGSKMIIFQKKWHSNLDTDDQLERVSKRTIVWHRDIAAAKCIMFKGKYEIYS